MNKKLMAAIVGPPIAIVILLQLGFPLSISMYAVAILLSMIVLGLNLEKKVVKKDGPREV